MVREVKEEAKVIKGEKSKDKTYPSSRTFPDEAAAKQEFLHAKERLFNVNGWSDIPGLANSGFQLYSASGQPLDRRQVQSGDFIEIDLPGPLPMYWVEVLDVKVEDDKGEFTVKPSQDPTGEEDPETTAHFFQEDARSTFMVERRGNKLVAKEIGTDEAINKEEPEAGDKGFLNTVVSEGGWAFFQEYQWKNLTDYLVGNSDGDEKEDMDDEPETMVFEDDGKIPNSKLPLLIYRDVFPARDDKGAAWLEQKFAENDWTNAWRNGIYDYHHYHSTSHEVLGVYAGSGLLHLGGEQGQRVNVEAGDVIVIPAGVGHKCLEDNGLKVVGAYPDGRSYDLKEGLKDERPEADENIAAVPLPATDPLYGKSRGLPDHWK